LGTAEKKTIFCPSPTMVLMGVWATKGEKVRHCNKAGRKEEGKKGMPFYEQIENANLEAKESALNPGGKKKEKQNKGRRRKRAKTQGIDICRHSCVFRSGNPLDPFTKKNFYPGY